MKLTTSCTGNSLCPYKPLIHLLSYILLLLFISTAAKAQQHTIQGTVIDHSTEEPLVNATVKLKNSKIITQTDEEGKFLLQMDGSEGVLEVSYLGYETKEVSFKETSDVLSIALKPNDSVLEEVEINAGYYTVTDRERTGSISRITAEEIEKQPVTNVLSALSGRMPGVFVQTTNGLPGGNINIKIRGTGSIAAGTQPLYIIDGVPFDGSPVNKNHNLAVESIMGALSPLNIINPSDIESITVLKDADATAIYGSRGSNGVVLVTTKKGRAGATRIDLNIQQGIHKAASYPDLLNLDEYLVMRKEAFANDGKEPSPDPTSPNYAPDLTVWSQTESTDWVKYLFGHTANLSEFQASISGGNSTTTFNISGNYRTESTILIGNNRYNRMGLRTHIQHQSVDQKFAIGMSGLYNIDNNLSANPERGLFMSLLLAPNYPLVNSDGSYNWYAGSNPLSQANADSRSETDNMVYNLIASYKLTPNFTIGTSLGYNKMNVDQIQIFPNKSIYPGTINYSNFGILSNNSIILEPKIDYAKKFASADLRGLLGFTYQTRSSQNQFIKASDFITESLMEDVSSAGSIDAITNKYTEYRYMSIFGRLTYKMKDRYIINGTIRRDGSSRFSFDNRFGTFASIGTGWVFGEEKWVKSSLPFLSFGKLRASFGTTGNDQITDYQYLSTYRSSSSYQGFTTLQPERILNPQDYHWETTKKLEFAAEFGFWKNKFRVDVIHYRNRSSDQLVSYTLPRITGFSSYQANLPAEVQNTGWEFELSSTNINNGDFSWRSSFNLTLPKNKLISFDNFENSSYRNTLQIGYDITRVTGTRFLGVNLETGIPEFADENGEVTTGTAYQYYTRGKVTSDMYGGIGNQFTYKGFQLNIFGQFSSHDVTGGMIYTPGVFIYNGYSNVKDRWRRPGDITSIPKSSTTNSSSYVRSTANFFKVTYFRVKNIALTYSFPEKFNSRLNLKQATILFEAQNAITFWNNGLPLIDPESGSLSSTRSGTPPIKTFVFGLRITI